MRQLRQDLLSLRENGTHMHRIVFRPVRRATVFKRQSHLVGS